jgi:hypothetical protein
MIGAPKGTPVEIIQKLNVEARPDISDGRGCKVKHHLHLTADQIGERRRRASIRHMKHIDASHHLKQLTSQVRRISDASRSHVELTRISFGIAVGDDSR